MDDYEKKFAEMQKYIPFLEAMIERLQKVTDKSREVQLHKMQQLHGILSDNKRKLKIETLQKCEDVLQKLHNKVEKGTNTGLNFPSKKIEEPGTPKTALVKSSDDKPKSPPIFKEQSKNMDETPASPSPPASPDEQPKSSSVPIIIPTERKHDYSSDRDSKPASPDQSERIPTKEPIIIPTERKDESSNDSVENVSSINSSVDTNKNSHDKSGAQNRAYADTKSFRKHLPTVPVPSAARRVLPLAEKNRQSGTILDSENDSTKLEPSTPLRLMSPDSRSPRPKELFLPSKNSKTSTPLLVSPPRTLTEPPLSMEDLAELLNDGSNSNPETNSINVSTVDKKSLPPSKPEKIRTPKDKMPEEPKKSEKERNPSAKSFVLTQEDIQRESDRRWEEIDKHIVKFGRKGLSSEKPLSNSKKPSEFRDSPMSPVGKDRGSEPRYADNYERIPRHAQDRYANPEPPSIPDMNVINSAFSRLSEGDLANLAKVQTNLPIIHKHPDNFRSMDDRELFQRRPNPPPMEMQSPRPEEEYYTRRPIHHPPPREYGNPQWGPHPNVHPNNAYDAYEPYPHPPNHLNHPPNHPGHPNHPPNHPGHPNHPPNHPNHPDMWDRPNQGPGPMDHPGHHMSPQYGPNSNRHHPLMSPRPDMNHGGYMDPNFPEDISRSPQPPPLIPPLMQGTGFNRGFPQENRSFEQPFERSREFAPSPMRPNPWDGPPHDRPVEPNYHDGLRGRGPEPPYNSPVPSGAPSWNRGSGPEIPPMRNRSNERFPVERGRPPHSDLQHPGFGRRSEWDRGPNENSPRFNREQRNVSERDPRFRKDPSPQASNSPIASTAKRDPRLSKEPVQSPTVPKPKEAPPVSVSRDPRRRNSDSKEQTKPIIASKPPRSIKNKPSIVNKGKESVKPGDIKSRRSSEETKPSVDKLVKDKETMQSPLESLYGVIDTTAKTGKGYGLQKFKIPKIKRSDPVPRPPTPPKPSVAEEEPWDDDPSPKPAENMAKSPTEDVKDTLKEDKKMEVTSTTDEPPVVAKSTEQDSKVSEAEPTLSNHVSVKSDKPEESEGTVDTSTSVKTVDADNSTREVSKESEKMFPKDEITREWIEKMIKNSLEQGEGKKLLEQAKLLQKLGEGLAHSKKFKKIRKIIESQSESSSSDEDEIVETKKSASKKKRRVIVSESSDDESVERNEAETDSVEKPKVTRRTRRRPGKGAKAKLKPAAEVEEKSVEDTKDVEKSQVENEAEEPAAPKPKRKPARRRNSLEMLQEDIREMFISEGVVTATGHRMCRLIKEAEGNLKAVSEKVKGVYAGSSPDRANDSGSEDAETPKRRNRSKSKTPKSREAPEDDTKIKTRPRRTRKRPVQISKQFVSSSESEEQTTPRRSRSRAASRKDTPDVSKDSDKTDAAPADESEGPTLRRSERVSMREPRVMIEKTDLGKIDSSKIMFDTSSDESFGIDVSELTAAVDISLHSDRQKRSEDDAAGIIKKLEEKPKKTRKRGSNESKADTSDKFDDDVMSAASDASVSSSNASSVKKITSTSTSLNTNEELITNILGDFVNDKGKIEEKTANKESDVEAEEGVEEPQVATKKPPLVRRKKKRNTWQMGILSKSKKKMKKKITRSCAAAAKAAILKKNSPAKSTKDEAGETKTPGTPKKPQDEKSDIEKMDSASTPEKSPKKIEIKQEKDLPEPFLSPDGLKTLFKTEDLIEYAWTGQERYRCLLCGFGGKNIVHHYKTVHPKDEIMISRLTLLDAKRAIDESKDEAFLKLSEKVNSGPNRKYTCRFCLFSSEGEKGLAMENFYEHCTTHTGEYRFKCKSCTYQTTVKSSMRAHYYKVCRKKYENFTQAVIEDPIPNEDLIYGYLCSACNFIQLKEENVKKHIEDFHKQALDVEVIKVNMSSYDVKDRVEHSDSEGDTKVDDSHGPDSDTSTVDLSEYGKKKKIVAANKNKSISDDSEVKEPDTSVPIAKSESPQDESDNPLTNKLSAFVCPPELENKEVEIQRERQKTMQELLKNYGTKFKNNSSAKGLSIIDKLKDKIATLGKEPEEILDIESGEDADEPQNEQMISISDKHEIDDGEKTEEDPLKVPEGPVDDSITAIDIESLDHSEPEISQDEDDANDKSDKKLRDPLMSLEDEPPKDFNSAEEVSDGEPMADLSRTYEDSDTSDDISDTELSTDVNTLLKETINTPIKAPMMTTIQRLAAQLSGSKSVPTSSETLSSENKRDSPPTSDSTKPIVMPISDLRNYVEKQNLLSKKSPDTSGSDTDRSNTPKNFIRLRRLSGDKLSSGAAPPEPSPPAKKEDKPAEVIESKEEECSFLKIENVISLAPSASPEAESPLIDDIRKAVATSAPKNVGVSVLKKASPNILKRLRAPIGKIDGILSRLPVIAPAPTQAKFVLQPLSKNAAVTSSSKAVITTITKPTVTTASSPTVTAPKPIAPAPPKAMVSTPKPTTTTLKPINAPQLIAPAPAKAVKLAGGKNYKIFKVLRPNAGVVPLKSKEAANSLAQKEKTFEAFSAMLQVAKLRHLYKCMGKTCTYSTDSVDLFAEHFKAHAQKTITDQNDSGYQKCAYCNDSMADWDEFYKHYKNKHTFCAYQCGYCFYRAFTQSYVDLHQSTAHQGKPASVILGIRDSYPIALYDRREYVHPFVCKHECNKLFYVPEAFIAHLKMKHGATLSIFKCHMCPASALKAEALISHYKMHGIYKYQCLYCIFGADAPMELHHHLSHVHSNKPPNILERSLPPTPVRDRDVLLQLLIKNLDETFTCSELKNVAEISALDGMVKRAKKDTTAETIASPGIKTYQGPSKPSMKLVEPTEVIDLFGGEKTLSAGSPVAQSTETIVRTSGSFNDNGGIARVLPDGATVEKQVTSILKPKSPPEPDPATEQLIHQEPELVLRYANERVKTQIANAVDPLSIPDSLNMNDEFVNINILDNPEFLKTAEQRASEKAKQAKVVEEDKNDDSDIEILECFEPPSKPKFQLTPIKESLKPFLRLKEEAKEPDVEKETPTIVCSSNENSNASVEFAGSTEAPAPPESDNKYAEKDNEKDNDIIEKPPLTLDDIKHTGFAGKDLYKCGFESCTFGAATPVALKGHIVECAYAVENPSMKCVHCTKKFIKLGNLIDHFKIHGLKRFGCSLCNMRYALACQAVAHMKARHKIGSHKLVPADPTNPSPDALFVVQPLGPGERKGKKLGKNKSFEFVSREKTSYGPNEIEKLPRQAIYNKEVQCAVCPYTTKVRMNIIRHLQLHAKDETVPESGPVNPVPCLEKKEKMFDKMVNLASSSHQNGRMGAKSKEIVPDSEAELLPKFVPEKQRYVCCVADCNCLTINEDLLRCHLKALHPEETTFRCPHCPPPGQDTQSIPIDKLGVHLKMHDTRLYKCSHCNHHHYHRHVVERHLSDKHPEKRPFVKVIREIENPETLEKPPLEDQEEGIPDPDGNHWKCNVCDYKCVYKTEMVAHAQSSHDEKAQFKCTLCPYKTSGKINFEQHILSKHINEPEADYTMIYERIKGTKKPDAAEIPVADEPFDTTPLWRRDMPRIRHIRGILLEDENEKKSSDSPAKSGKRKSDIESASKPAKIKPKSMSLDGTNLVEKGKGPEGSKPVEKEFTDAELEEKFGPYGKPTGNMYFCTICSFYSSKYRQDIRDHLYMELKYWRWHCKDCGHLAVSHSRMLKHLNKTHKDKKAETVELEVKKDVDQWVLNLMNIQRAIMRGEIDAPSSPAKSKAPTSLRISPPTITLEDSGGQIIPSSNIETPSETSKRVDLTAAISKLVGNENDSDDEDDDGNALIIDSKEMDDSKDLSTSQVESSPSKEADKKYICKHCNVEFTGLRGFKIHVQINHLKRLAFVCPYCDRSTNSETMMRQHIRAKHAGQPETIVKNPSSKGPVLNNAFWEREYGIDPPKKVKKKKRKVEELDTSVEEEKMGLSDICVKCGFTAINSTGLKAHMRAHAKRHSLKCVHCSFTANSQTDIWQHSEINHPQLDWRAEEINSPGSSNDQPVQHVKKRHLEDYNEDIEEETAPVSSEEPEKKIVYTCFYCKSVRSTVLATIRAHWSQYHKDPNDQSVYQTAVPFKFTESFGNVVETPKLMKCGYCPKKGSAVALRTHLRKKHPNLPVRIVEPFDTTQDVWICKWCNEKVEGGMKRTAHHNMFHSHLPIRFKRGQESTVKQKGFVCPECPFISVTYARMRTHVGKHVDVFKCKRCSRKFSSIQTATLHSTTDHPTMPAALERTTRDIDTLMAKVTQTDMTYIPEEEPQTISSTDIFRNLGVARKSTTKQLLRKPSTTLKAVARKSTHPLPRYPPGLVFDTEGFDSEVESFTESSGWSYYGRPPTPVNLENLNTMMCLGAAKMKVKCTKLAKLMNIDVRVVLVDCKKVKTK